MILGRIRRVWWQLSWAILFNFPFLAPLTFAWMPVPVLNCYACPLAQGACPIGTLQHFLVIASIPFFTVGVIAAFGALAGRFYCSHFCPFGFFQDLLGRLTQKKYRLPSYAGYGKYLSLVLLALILPPILKEPFFCTLCPAGSLEAGIPIAARAWAEKHFAAEQIFGGGFGILNMIGWWFWFKIGILVAMIGAAIITRRPFCRTACPLGAMLGLFNRVSLLVHPPSDDTDRSKYNLRNCPVGITHPDQVDSHNCIKCRECYGKREKTEDRSQKTE